MKEEVKRWWDKAKDDVIKAKDNLSMDHYDLASFLCQQAVEKALKAAIIKKKKIIPKIHDLVKLAKLADLDKGLIGSCERLTYVYIDSRYPDTGTKEYTKSETEEDIEAANKIIKWIEEKLL
tara:strand:+ start:1772 stop:2137 length:366 start_codon:yes stop_codon:yes gene_type:complete